MSIQITGTVGGSEYKVGWDDGVLTGDIVPRLLIEAEVQLREGTEADLPGIGACGEFSLENPYAVVAAAKAVFDHDPFVEGDLEAPEDEEVEVETAVY